jgi:hypothetical protein
MADRFPLIVNSSSKKIEELISGDNLDLSGNGIAISGSTGTAGQYLKSTGAGLLWDNPGDVYLTVPQTITNKTIESSIISGTTNTFTFIPNSALVNSSITVNGTAISLGGTVTTPDNNTTYSISAQDGGNAATKLIRLTSGGNSGAGVDDDVSLVAGTNVTLSRTGDAITINSSYVDTNTVTRLAASGGTLVSGDVTFAVSGNAAAISQVGNTITIAANYVNTVTRLRGTAAGTYTSGDLQLLAGSNVTITQASGTPTDITIASQDTVTRLRATGGTLGSGDFTFATATGSTTAGANGVNTTTGAASISQVGNTITIDAQYVNTVTSLKANTEADGNARTGIITITGGGATSVTRGTGATANTFTISSTDNDTTYSAGTAITLTGTVFSLKNNANLTGNRLLKWDSGNSQVTNSIISDDGSVVTIAGDLTVTGATTTLTSQTLVIADAQIELRKGLNLTGVDAGVQVNRTTNALGVVSSYSVMQWFETGGYWRVYDGSVANRLVTEGETQTLTNKTLTNPTLTTPTLGAATATTINGLAISQTVSGTLTIANNKTLTCNNTLTFSGTDASTVGFGTGGTVVYTTNNLSVFGSTTSAQLRGVLSDETGVGVAVFGTSPTFTTSVLTGDTTFAVFNTTATTINAFGAATTITMGATTGTTTIRNNLTVNGTTNLGDVVGDTINLNGTVNFVNADFTVRGSSANPIAIGRGGNAIPTNTRMGYNCLNSNTSGSQNVAIGYEAAKTINSGASIVAIGYQALTNAGTGQHNIAIGRAALTAILGGERNVGVGSNTLEGNTTGNNNVAIGYYAGGGATGSGNVLIGPAPDGNSTNVTYTPPTPSGDNQLVIGSGTSTWVRGDANFDVTLPQNANVGGNLTVSGTLTVNGTTTTINTNVLEVDDKEISLAAISARTFTATIVSNNANITAISPVAGLIPGMVVSISTGGLSVPVGTTIVSITNNTALLSNNVTGSSGTATFNAQGATDTTADGGGFRIKGTTDKTLTYTNATVAFTSSEHFDLATGKAYRIGNVQIANGNTTTLGPTTGSWSIGAGVTTSSLTQVGTLSSLTVSGNLTVDTNTLVVDAANNRVGVGTTPTAVIHIKAGTATSSTAPLKIDSGTVLTTPEANAFEYDGVLLYHTQNDTTNGNKRAVIPEVQYQRRTSQVSITATATPGTSIFGNTSRAALLAGNIYEVEAVVWLTKVTNAGTATLQLSLSTGNFTFASAQLSTSATVVVLNGTTSPVSLPATISLTAGTTYGVILRGIVQPASNARLDVLLFGSATSITVESGTFMKVTCLGTASTIGNFA